MQDNTKKILILSLIIVGAALTRLIPHPMNFAPLGAMALFGSAYLGRKGLGLLVTMLSWMLSDLVLNNLVYTAQSSGFVLFTEGSVFIYGSIVLIYLLGTGVLKKVTAPRMLVGSLGASIIFFLLSNFGVWVQGYYPMDTAGLIACYTAAIPFFKFTIAGDLFYSGILFLLYERILRTSLIPVKVKKK